MEVPAEVMIHNELVGMKGSRGTLLQVSPQGYYEANVKFGDRLHRVLLPVSSTVIIWAQPEETVAGGEFEVER